jgi:hypothetical protein
MTRPDNRVKKEDKDALEKRQRKEKEAEKWRRQKMLEKLCAEMLKRINVVEKGQGGKKKKKKEKGEKKKGEKKEEHFPKPGNMSGAYDQDDPDNKKCIEAFAGERRLVVPLHPRKFKQRGCKTRHTALLYNPLTEEAGKKGLEGPEVTYLTFLQIVQYATPGKFSFKWRTKPNSMRDSMSGTYLAVMMDCPHTFTREFPGKGGKTTTQLYKCNRKVDMESIISQMPDCKDKVELKKIVCQKIDAFLLTNDFGTFCPNKKCKNTHTIPLLPFLDRKCKPKTTFAQYPKHWNGLNIPMWTCSDCSSSWCVKCLQAGFDNQTTYHDGMKCKQFQMQSRRKEITENEVKEMRQNNLAYCPNCPALIQKSEGCDHMDCAQCGTAFCWVCNMILDKNAPYRDHLIGDGLLGTYECPKRTTGDEGKF